MRRGKAEVVWRGLGNTRGQASRGPVKQLQHIAIFVDISINPVHRKIYSNPHPNAWLLPISPPKALALQSSSSCAPSSWEVDLSRPADDANTLAGRDLVCPNVLGVRRSGLIGREQARSLAVIMDVLCTAALPSSECSSRSSIVDSMRSRFLSDGTGVEEENCE